MDIAAERRKRASRIGKGRYGFDDYPDSPITNIDIVDKKAGDICQCCNQGKLYHSEPRKLLQFTGNPPVTVERVKKAVLRCNSCGLEFMSHRQVRKWDYTARSSIVLQKLYGMPFYRLSKLQSLYNIPVAESTLWLQVLSLWEDCGSEIYRQLMTVAKDSKLFYADDTGAKILEVIQNNKLLARKQSRSCNTTTVCTKTAEDHNIILYITDNKHLGENIVQVITDRSNKDHYLKLMVDASSRNIPDLERGELSKLLISNCLTHGRHKFADIADYYPEECGYFLNEIAGIYKIDNETRNYDSRKRLRHHKKHSTERIKNIYNKIGYLFSQKLVEPNSALGRAMNYWLNHKKGLTRFLKVKGAPLDNNKSERALKSMILQRKNSLFFKSKNSAAILSGLSSIVRTCEANDINGFAYLNWIQANWTKVQKDASNYLPWKYLKYRNDTELMAAA